MFCRGFVIMSCQCFVSDAPDPFLPLRKTFIYNSSHRWEYNNLPASRILPINSFLPILSKSITITSSEHSLIFSHGTLNENESLKTGFKLHLYVGVLRFSMRLSPNWSHTFTYGSAKNKNKNIGTKPTFLWFAFFPLPDFPLMSLALRFLALSKVIVSMLLLGW